MKTSLRVLRALGPIDFKSIRRDSLLAWMMLVPLLVGLVLRLFVPGLAGRLRTATAIDLEVYYPLIMSYFVAILTPQVVGFVIGFLLLDERDDGTLTALLVTPMPPGSYLTYRIGVPIVACGVMTVIGCRIAGLVPPFWGRSIPVVVVAALGAPLLALAMAAFAANKVQGFALMKGLGVVIALPLLGWFVDPPLQFLFGLLPNFWAARAFWSAGQGGAGFWIPLAVGGVYQAALLAVIVRRLHRRLHRA